MTQRSPSNPPETIPSHTFIPIHYFCAGKPSLEDISVGKYANLDDETASGLFYISKNM